MHGQDAPFVVEADQKPAYVTGWPSESEAVNHARRGPWSVDSVLRKAVSPSRPRPVADGPLSEREAVPATPGVTLGEPLRIEIGDDDERRARQPGELCLIAFGPVPRRAVGLGFEGAEAGLSDQFPRAGRGAVGPD